MFANDTTTDGPEQPLQITKVITYQIRTCECYWTKQELHIPIIIQLLKQQIFTLGIDNIWGYGTRRNGAWKVHVYVAYPLCRYNWVEQQFGKMATLS